ncbi:MAG: class I SAM-dependent methyltransferase [Deltaproteobacteria bacterium]|nr:class I SAM-dependent methyltransferase [Deltaproteobacteria bacterium]
MSKRQAQANNKRILLEVQMRDLNKAHWEEVSKAHDRNHFYLTDRVLKGGLSLSKIECREIGNINNLNGVHLQCGIGLDTVSLQRLGASMTGIDFARSAIASACSIAERCALPCLFVVADVLERNQLPKRLYDFVYSSHGVLRWIPNLNKWTRNAAALIRSGGFLYLFEIHPLVYRLTNVVGASVHLTGDYFYERPQIKEISGTHTGPFNGAETDTVVHTNWTLGKIVTSIVSAGLELEFLHEHDCCSYSRKDLISRRSGTLWRLSAESSPIPLSFSLRARKP